MFLALACLLRQECVLFALAFAAVELRGRGRSRMAALLPFVTLVGWTIFRLVYYGRWFPIPYHVKGLPLIVDLEYGLRYLWQGTLECGVGPLVVLGLFAASGPRDGRRDVTTATALAVLLHTIYVVGVGGDFVELSRFFMPSLPLMILLGSVGARSLVRHPWVRVGLAIAALLCVQWAATSGGTKSNGRSVGFSTSGDSLCVTSITTISSKALYSSDAYLPFSSGFETASSLLRPFLSNPFRLAAFIRCLLHLVEKDL